MKYAILSLCSLASAFVPVVNFHRNPSLRKLVQQENDASVDVNAEPPRHTALVWLTGFGDLRSYDHPGLELGEKVTDETGGEVVPLFILDDQLHLKNQPELNVRRLHASLTALQEEVPNLVIRSSSSPSPSGTFCDSDVPSHLSGVLLDVAKQCGASTCVVVEDDVTHEARLATKSACAEISSAPAFGGGEGIHVVRWTPALRPSAPWERSSGSKHPCFLPSEYETYRRVADSVPLRSTSGSLSQISRKLPSSLALAATPEGLPSLDAMLARWRECSSPAVHQARQRRCSTTPPFVSSLASLLPQAPTDQLDLYLKLGPTPFAENFFTAETASAGAAGSLHAAAMRWVLADENKDSAGPPNQAVADVSSDGFPSHTDDDSSTPGATPTLPFPLLQSIASQNPFASRGASSSSTAQSSSTAGTSARLAALEPATRLLAGHLALGSISPSAALSRAHGETAPATGTPSSDDAGAPQRGGQGRGKDESLAKALEWAEWHRLFARAQVESEERKEAARSNSGSSSGDGSAEHGPSRFWRWNGEHLVRYRVWSSSEAPQTEEDDQEPVLVLVHGFGASSDQWERLVKSMRNPCRLGVWKDRGLQGPPKTIFALDLLGFGHSSKPGVTYTQHLWEAQISDFVVEVCGARPFVLAGNSIGGGLSCGVAANLPELCKGVVLCNTAGNILVPQTGGDGSSSGEGDLDETADLEIAGLSRMGDATLQGPEAMGSFYKPPPSLPGVVEQSQLLEGFGDALIAFLKPQIPSLLKKYYPVVPENADANLAAAIARDAGDPGAGNVIGSGQKLPPQRPLNEVLGQPHRQLAPSSSSSPALVEEDELPPPQWSFHGPVLVAQGILDPLAGAERTQLRLEQLVNLRDGITGTPIKGGHCPHDEVPDAVASAIAKWWPRVLEHSKSSSTTTSTTTELTENESPTKTSESPNRAPALQ